MATPDMATDSEWGRLVSLGSEERESRIAQRYGELFALSDQEMRNRMLAMVRVEYALTDQELRPFTISRLRVWTRLEPEVAKRIAAAYDDAMLKMPAPQAMRRVALVQTLVKDFSPEEQQILVNLVPRVFAGMPLAASVAQVVARAPREPLVAEQKQPSKKGWWPFAKR